MSYSVLTSTHGTSVRSSEGRREILVAALEGQMSGLLLDQFPRGSPVRALRINTHVLAAAFGEGFSTGDPWPDEPLRWKGGLIHV